jgi:hypothetical protein
MGISFQPLLFSGLTLGSSGDATGIGTLIVGADPNAILVTDSDMKLADIVITDGQVLIGSTGAAPVAATITGTTNQLIVTNGPGSITLSLPQDIDPTSSPTFVGLTVNTIDTTLGGTIAFGTGNADIINIGNPGATVNIQGDTIYQNVTDLNVTDKNITVNYGGSVGSASNAGIGVEEGGIITAYVDTSADRNSWEFKAPATTGIATITPGTSGFTIDQGSHNPVTLGTANGLSLSVQELSLALADTSTTGALSDTDWNTFTTKANPELDNLTTTAINVDLLPDGTRNLGDASHTWNSLAVTTVFNPFNQGIDLSDGRMVDANGDTQIQFGSSGVSFNQLTVDTVPYLDSSGFLVSSVVTPTELDYISGVTSSIQDQLDGKQASGNYITDLIGDGTASGPGTATFTLATVNSDIGGFNNVEVNEKGLVTAASNIDYVLTIADDIVPTIFDDLINNTPDQDILGLSFATTVNSFEVLMNIQIDATTPTYTTLKLLGTRKNAANWGVYDLEPEFTGDPIIDLAFAMSAFGQITISIGDITGFSSASIRFRAITL